MSIEKKQVEIQHTFKAQNKFLRLTEKTGSHPAVNLNDFGNDIRSVRVSEIGVLISLLMSVEKHLNKEEPELKPPFGEDEPEPEPEEEDDDTERYNGYGKDSPLPDPVQSKHPFFSPEDRWIAGEDVVRAWTIVGRSEAYHEAQISALKQRWPALHTAVENFVRIRPHDAG